MVGNILVVEDDLDLNFILCKILTNAGHRVQSAFSGSEALALLERGDYDGVILDLMLPEVSGEALISWVRKVSTVPILVVSAKSGLDSRVEVLGMGADDYLVKPFESAEVLARVGALLRRSKQFARKEAKELRHKNVVLDRKSHLVSVLGQELTLTSKEFKILSLLLANPKTVYTKPKLYEAIWDEDYAVEENALNVHVSNLRKKLKAVDSGNDYIETVWGIGFKLSL